MKSVDIGAILAECGLKYGYVSDGPNVLVELDEGADCSYDVLSKIAARLGTTDIRFGYEKEQALSEVTFESSRGYLRSQLPKEVGK